MYLLFPIFNKGFELRAIFRESMANRQPSECASSSITISRLFVLYEKNLSRIIIVIATLIQSANSFFHYFGKNYNNHVKKAMEIWI